MRHQFNMKIFNTLMLTTAFLAVGCSERTDKSAERSATTPLSSSPSLSAQKLTHDISSKAFTHPFDGMNNSEMDTFILGKSFFRIPWVEAPSATTARDGLGPLFSANTCMNCHPHNGAGVAVNNEGTLNRELVLRLSLKTELNLNNKSIIQTNGFSPEPTYGGQLSLNGTSDTPFEGRPVVKYVYKEHTYSDAQKVSLRYPSYSIENLQYGALHNDTNIAPHIALALVGLGFIEDIKQEDILDNEDINDSNADGISGKANWIYSHESKQKELGRFTHKAAANSVKYQTAIAAINDMGLTTSIFATENCMPTQRECLKAEKARHEIDLSDERLDAIAYYLTHLKVPAQRNFEKKKEAKELFNSLTCNACHTPSYTTKKGEFIEPFSDFLLHDMGDVLSDGHSNFLATANEFRTPPLWGVGLYKVVSGEANYLHDGRARSLEEAILFHGGEAQGAKEKFSALNKEKRELLLQYLKSI